MGEFAEILTDTTADVEESEGLSLQARQDLGIQRVRGQSKVEETKLADARVGMDFECTFALWGTSVRVWHPQ